MALISRYITNDYLLGLKSMQLKTRHILQGTMLGRHNSPFHGYSSEFSQYRSYTPGDDFKHFDWKIYGKTEKLMIKQYRDETNANVYLVLDSSDSMDYQGQGNISKLQYASILAASLAMLAHQQRDRVSLINGADDVTIQTTLKNTAGNVKMIHNVLEKIKARGVTDLARMLNKLAPLVNSGSITYIFSDLWTDPEKLSSSLSRITHKSRATRLVQVLTPEEIDFFEVKNAELKDLETGEKVKISSISMREEYLESLEDHTFKIRTQCAKLGIAYIRLCTNQPFYQAMRELLMFPEK